MYLDNLLAALLLLFLPGAAAARPPKNAILLSDVQSLTLRGSGAMTTHRRVSAVPQLKCISSKGICNLHEIDVMRCTNQGSGYNSQDIQWSCTASLPQELKLGSTDVVCEGYASRDDPYILKGSCGVEYRLILTDKGEQRYPHLANGGDWFGGSGESDWSGYLFAIIFFAVVAWIIYAACTGGDPNRRVAANGGRQGWGGGGGGGGGWGPGWGPGNDPPPPYPGTKPSQAGWQPGFWSGLAGGAAAGYWAGRNNNRDTNRDNFRDYGSSWGSRGSSWGAGPSRSTTSSSSGSARHESTGFGSTSRR